MNTLSDSLNPGAGLMTLRQAVSAANAHHGADTINFNSSVFSAGSPHAILLTQGQINLTDTSGATTITGPGESVLAMNGSNTSRIFQISSGVTVSISGVTITGGAVSSASGEPAIGGGVVNAGSLTLTNVDVSGDSATAGNGGTAQGGGVYSSNSLWVINSTISGNTAQGGADTSSTGVAQPGGNSSGGAIWSTGLLNVSNSVISGNTAVGGGGPRYTFSGLGGYAEGGGIYTSGDFTLASTTVSNNTAQGGPDMEGGASSGGGIYILGEADLVDSTCSGNMALGGGGDSDDGGGGGNASGGAVFSNATVTVNSTTFTSNKAYGGYSPAGDNGPAGNAYGGAITALGSITITGSTLNENQAEGGGGNGNSNAQVPDANGSGGGIYATATLVIAGCTLSGNSAKGAGDAIYGADGGIGQGGGFAATGTATVSASSITGNSAIGGSGATGGDEYGNHGNGGEGEGGGGFGGGTLTVTSSTISGNQCIGGAGQFDDPDESFSFAGSGGAAVGGGLASVGAMTLSNSTIANNEASGGAGANDEGNATTGANGGNAQGGGIFSSMSITLADMTVVGNTTAGGAGGAAWPNDSPPTPGATGSAQGGGIYAANNSVLDNSILSANNGASGADVYSTLSATSGYNLIGYGGGLTNGVNGNQIGIHDPMLAALASNGGPTQTMLPLAGSPVINAGSNALIPSGVTTDQRGDSRIYNGIVDIGAVEIQQGLGSVSLTAPADQSAIDGESGSFNLGSFSEANASAPFDVTLNWGDGSAVTSLVLSAAGVIPAQAHTYRNVGTDTVTVTVSGSQVESASSKQFQVTVADHATPAGILTASSTFAAFGSSVTVTATISGSVGTPTGTVIFSNNGVEIGTRVLADGVATLTTSALPIGSNSITAYYSGAGNYLAADVPAVVIGVYQPSLVTVAFTAKTKLPATLIAGQKLVASTSMLLTNTGAVEKGVFTFKYYLSSSPSLEANQTPVFTVSKRISLKQGKPVPLAVSVRSTATNLSAGTYYLLGEIVDPAGLISIAAAPQPIEIQAPYVELSASVSATKPAVISVKREGSLMIVLTNTGNIAASGVLSITVNPSSNGSVLSPAIATFVAKTTIKAGGKKKIVLRLKIPASLGAGSYLPSLSISLGSSEVNIVGSSGFVVN